jgi:hypothetical protein
MNTPTPISFTPNSGSRRAAERVKQKLRRDQLHWSINGMRRRPRRRILTQHCINHEPWNDRFIFDDETSPSGCNAPPKIWKRSSHKTKNDNSDVLKW